MVINQSIFDYHVTNFNTFFRWLWQTNQNPNHLNSTFFLIRPCHVSEAVFARGGGGGGGQVLVPKIDCVIYLIEPKLNYSAVRLVYKIPYRRARLA